MIFLSQRIPNTSLTSNEPDVDINNDTTTTSELNVVNVKLLEEKKKTLKFSTDHSWQKKKRIGYKVVGGRGVVNPHGESLHFQKYK